MLRELKQTRNLRGVWGKEMWRSHGEKWDINLGLEEGYFLDRWWRGKNLSTTAALEEAHAYEAPQSLRPL